MTIPAWLAPILIKLGKKLLKVGAQELQKRSDKTESDVDDVVADTLVEIAEYVDTDTSKVVEKAFMTVVDKL